MNNLDYNNWLKTLKSGDNVRIAVYTNPTYSYNETIKRITPNGNFRLSNDELFNNNGDLNKVVFKRMFPSDSTGY